MNTTPRSCWSGAARPFHPFGRGLLMLLSALLLVLPFPSFAAPGDLDPSFDGDGRVLTDFGGFEGVAAIMVQPDGKLLTAGGYSDFVLARYNRDGSLDRSFGGDGRVVTDLGRRVSGAYIALVVQPDGKLVTGGTARSSHAGSNAIVARYHPNGGLDPGFGASGLVVVPGGLRATGLVLQPDGKLVVQVAQAGPSLFRFHGDGTLDTSFGGNGSVPGKAISRSFGTLVLQPDGKLVRAGRTIDFNAARGDRDLALERFNSDGSPDTSFGSGGLVVTDFGVASEANRLLLQADGKLVAAGVLGAFDRVLARYHSDGSLDTSFGTGGVVVTDGVRGDRVWHALVLQPDGNLVAVSLNSLVRFNLDGSLDTSFGTGGVAPTDFGGSIFVDALVFQPDGKLVAAGTANASGDFDFALARYVTTNEPLAVPPTCGGRPATILGTSRKDTIRGTSGPDVILGRGGNDTIRGLEGNDTICGGAGRDTLIGDDGKDRLLGEGGDDKLFGDKGRDRLDGGSGRDACRTGERARRCEGKPASSDVGGATQGSTQAALPAGGQLPV